MKMKNKGKKRRKKETESQKSTSTHFINVARVRHHAGEALRGHVRLGVEPQTGGDRAHRLLLHIRQSKVAPDDLHAGGLNVSLQRLMDGCKIERFGICFSRHFAILRRSRHVVGERTNLRHKDVRTYARMQVAPENLHADFLPVPLKDWFSACIFVAIYSVVGERTHRVQYGQESRANANAKTTDDPRLQNSNVRIHPMAWGEQVIRRAPQGGQPAPPASCVKGACPVCRGTLQDLS